MTPATIVQQAQADGVMLALSPTGTIKATGNGEAVNRWLPVIRGCKAELLEMLRAANEAASIVRREVTIPEEGEVVNWLERILEDDPAVYRETLAKCRANPEALRFFLDYARSGTVH